MECSMYVLLSDREGKSEKLTPNPNLDSILHSYGSGNYVNYENITSNYSQTPYYYAIIVLGGGPIHTEYRLKEAIELYKQGIAKYLIVTIGKNEEEASIAEKIIKDAGINNYIIDNGSKTTAHNASRAKYILQDVLHAPENTRAKIVTERDHCERAEDTFNLIFRGKYKVDATCIDSLSDRDMWGKEEKIKRIRKHIRPLYPLLIGFLTYSEKYLSYLPGMNKEKAEKTIDKLIIISSDVISYLFNTALKYANYITDYINRIKTYRSSAYASSSS
jgi:vancomycin permeability regulator SanA